MRVFLLSSLFASFQLFAQPTNLMIDAGIHHLGVKEIKGFPAAARKPSAAKLEVTFEAQSNSSEQTLRLKQQDVTDDWGIEVNGRRIGRLNVQGAERISHFPLAPGVLVEGSNTLSIVPRNPADDILVGEIEILPKPMRDVLKLGRVVVNITDLSGRVNMPARITVANATNKLAELYNVTPAVAAWRRGIIYNAGGPVEFDLPEGDWILWANRGMEWSRPQVKLRVFVGQVNRITLPIAHEVDTTGHISVDTHLHTYTFSGHGDASLDERIWTLAGEGLEMAIATDHNHFTDYTPRRDALGASPYFTGVIGNEVTSANGHFNGFPFALDAVKPDHKETNWVKLVADIRSKGAQYVVLNHPRWPAITNSPFSIWGVDRVVGSRTNAAEFTFDAMELVNSSFPLKTPEYLLRDWFALLSRGERIAGVGSSDTHTISEAPGQGRTYVPSATDNPAAIDVDAVIAQMRAGNLSLSYGIFGDVLVNGKARMGQTVGPSNGFLHVSFRVASPSWVNARKAVVYVNGIKAAQQDLVRRAGAPLSTNVSFRISAPPNDAFLVCVAYGDGVKEAAWKTLSDYTLAVTNPVWIDVDGDGKYRSPREAAVAALDAMQPLSLGKLEAGIEKLDAAAGVQMMAEAKLRLPAGQLEAWDRLLEKLSLRHDAFLFYRSPSAIP